MVPVTMMVQRTMISTKAGLRFLVIRMTTIPASREPFRRSLFSQLPELNRAFLAPVPLPQFVIVRNLLAAPLLSSVVAACERATYSTYCAYLSSTESGRAEARFVTPNEYDLYVTIHERSPDVIPEIQQLQELFSREETINAISRLTSIPLQRLVPPSVLSCWGPGSFFEAHTDYNPHRPARLVLSLSLTTQWQASYGGSTVYSWSNTDAAVRLQPRLNRGVLFVPSRQSVHWVEQVAAAAPPRRRFTWTASFA